MWTLILRLIDKARCPICGLTLEQQHIIRNALWASRGILLNSRNAHELSDQDYVLVIRRFDQIDTVLKHRKPK